MDARKQAWYIGLTAARKHLEAVQAACPYCDGRSEGCHYCGRLLAAAKLVDAARFAGTLPEGVKP